MSADVRLLRWPAQDRAAYGKLAAALSRVRDAAARSKGDFAVAIPGPPQDPDDLDRARTLYAQRRARDAAAGADADLFAEPAWDIMLSLFVAHGERRRPALAEMMEVSGVRPAAARRWIDQLAARGLIGIGTSDECVATERGIEFVRGCLGPI